MPDYLGSNLLREVIQNDDEIEGWMEEHVQETGGRPSPHLC